MFSYKDELKKYEPAMLIEDMEDSIYSADFRDIFELMQYIVDSSKKENRKGVDCREMSSMRIHI